MLFYTYSEFIFRFGATGVVVVEVVVIVVVVVVAVVVVLVVWILELDFFWKYISKRLKKRKRVISLIM